MGSHPPHSATANPDGALLESAQGLAEGLSPVAFQSAQRVFSEATGLASAVLSPDGHEIGGRFGTCSFCEMVRSTPNGLAACQTLSEQLLQEAAEHGVAFGKCNHGQLWHAAVRVDAWGRHAATWLCGQLGDTDLDVEALRTSAAEFGLDPEALVASRRLIEPGDKPRLERATRLLQHLAGDLSASAEREVRLARLVEEARRLADVSRVRAGLLEDADERTPESIMQQALDELIQITGSAVGTLQMKQGDGDDYCVWSGGLLDGCGEGKLRHRFGLGTADGPWAQCVSEQRHVMWHADGPPAERAVLPPEHTPIDRLLVVPVVRDSVVIAVVGLANKPFDYTPADTAAVEYLAELAADLIRHQRAKRELRAAEGRYRTLVDTSTDGFWLVDSGGLITATNSAYSAMSGFSESEILGSPITKFEASEDASDVQSHVARILALGHDRFESRHRRKDGSTYAVEVSAQTIGDSIAAFTRDVTRRVEAREALELAERHMRLAQRAAHMVSWRWNPGTDAFEWSGDVVGLFGPEVARLASGGDVVRHLVHVDDRKGVVTKARDAADRSTSFETEFRLATDETRWLLLRADAESGAGDEYFGVAVDISELKRAQIEVAELTVQLRRLSRMTREAEEEQRRLLAAELHDRVSQSLAVAKINLQLAAQDFTSPEVVQAISFVSEALEETRAITAELSPPILNELGLAAALEWLVGRSRRLGVSGSTAGSGGDLKDIDRETAALVFRAVRELIANVARHSGSDTYSLSWTAEGSEYRFRVCDGGVGFDGSALPELPREDGGFGLFSVRERLKELGGHLDVSSSPGAGTVATIVIPRELP